MCLPDPATVFPLYDSATNPNTIHPMALDRCDMESINEGKTYTILTPSVSTSDAECDKNKENAINLSTTGS